MASGDVEELLWVAASAAWDVCMAAFLVPVVAALAGPPSFFLPSVVLMVCGLCFVLADTVGPPVLFLGAACSGPWFEPPA